MGSCACSGNQLSLCGPLSPECQSFANLAGKTIPPNIRWPFQVYKGQQSQCRNWKSPEKGYALMKNGRIILKESEICFYSSVSPSTDSAVFITSIFGRDNFALAPRVLSFSTCLSTLSLPSLSWLTALL